MGGYVKDGYTQVGVASWYGIDEHNNHAANGERFSKYAYTAAHRSLPMGTVLAEPCPRQVEYATFTPGVMG